jgi:hypothetical protein
MHTSAKYWSRRLLGIVILGLPVAASGQTCEEGKRAQLSIGARQIHCQGGTCRAYGAVAVSSNTVLRQGFVVRRGEGGNFRWEFSVEPILWRIDSLGPGAQKLRNGDVLVAVNGFTVTSERGSIELGDLQVDVPIRLLIRRDDRTLEVDITPAWTCDAVVVSAGPSNVPPSVAIGLQNLRRVLRAQDTLQVQEYRRAREALRRGDTLQVQGDSLRGTLTTGDSLGLRLGILNTLRSRRGSGTLGLGIRCSHCSFRYPSGDSSAVWEFSEFPEVMSVEDGGAADEAGLEVGDILTHVDGMDLTSAAGGKRWGNLKAGDEVEIRYRRGNESHTTTLTVDPAMR